VFAFWLWVVNFRAVKRLLKKRRPNRKVMRPNVMGKIIPGVQVGIFKKAIFPISASFLMNFSAAYVKRTQMEKENKRVIRATKFFP
jgi:hypothetical protein